MAPIVTKLTQYFVNIDIAKVTPKIDEKTSFHSCQSSKLEKYNVVEAIGRPRSLAPFKCCLKSNQ